MSKFTGNIIRLPAVTPTQNSASGVYTLDDQFTAQSSGTWPIVRDQYFNYTTLLLTGAVQGTAYPNPVTQPYSFLSDASTNNFVVSPNGDVSARPFNPYLNNYSNYFDGSGDYLSIANNPALQLTGEFTIEAWYYPLGFPGAGAFDCLITTGDNTTTSNAIAIYISSTGGINLFNHVTNSSIFDTASGVTLNTWNHIAATRNASNGVNLWLNGVSQGSTVTVSSGFTSTSLTRIGSSSNNQDCYGYISNARIVKGTAVYTGAFTPPTAPLTAITNTSLLTCQSNRFRDVSGNGFTITVNGSPAVSQNSPFVSYDTTNGSGYFDGTGDYLTVANQTALQLSGDFTIDGWVYGGDLGNVSGQSIIGDYFRNNAEATSQYQITWNKLNKYISFYLKTSGGFVYLATSNGTAPSFSWNHFALVRSGSTIRLYCNGVGTSTATDSTQLNSGFGTWIGVDANNTGEIFNGYVSNLRVVKGTAIYDPSQSTLTVPTAPATPVSGTSLLTLQTRAPATNNGFIDSSPNNFVVTRNGNTTQGSFSPFSPTGWSGYFSSISNYIRSTSNVSSITGDFTIECWVYWSSSTGSKIITALSADSIDLWINAPTGTITYYTGAATRITTTLTAPQNDWTHIALVRSSGVTTIYIDGTADSATYTSSATIGSGSEFLYIGRDSGTSFMAGYISNFRLVIGRAVYTSNFTPSITPLGNTTGGQNPPQGTETKLLTLQSNRFVDNASSGLGISVVGSPSVQAFSPFAPAQSYIPSQIGGSGYFPGSTSVWLVAPDNPALELGSNDFTIECWVYSTADFSANRIFTSKWNHFVFGINSTPALSFAWYGTTNGSATGTLISTAPNAWHHFAVCRQGSTLYMFQNGQKLTQSNSTITGTLNNDSYGPMLGGNENVVSGAIASANEPWYGYISGYRMVNGTALYTSSFPIPTAPPTAIPNTSLLLNFTNGGIVDATGKNNLETVANSGVQTSIINPFGSRTGLMYFNGSSYFYEPYTQLMNQLSGNFTIECWIYPTVTSTRMIFAGSISNAGSDNWFWEITSANKLSYTFSIGGSSVTATSTASISQNTWTYVAVVRSGGTLTQYINGSSDGTANPTAGAYRNASFGFAIGRGGDFNSLYFTGYIDEFRMTIGQARTITASPTGPFPLG